MIGLENQYLFKFSIADKHDFIQEGDLTLFKIVEEAGNTLPKFELIFSTQDEKVFGCLNEGNVLKISYGKDKNDLIDSSLIIASSNGARSGQKKRQIRLVGLLAKTGYISDTKKKITDKISGIEALKETVEPYFKTDFNIEKSNDSQYWIQPNTTDKMFVNDCWLHSNLNKSFPVCGITMDGIFILKDLKKDLKNKFKWRFISTPSASNDIRYDEDFGIDINSGFLNNLIGYGREKLIYNFEEGTEEYKVEEMTSILALTKKLGRRKDAINRFSSIGIHNENKHENYENTYLKNLTHLAMFGSLKISVSFQNNFVPIKILDSVMFKDDDVNENNNASSEYHSGLYYVGLVARILQHKQFVTTVHLGRESLNQLKGDLK